MKEQLQPIGRSIDAAIAYGIDEVGSQAAGWAYLAIKRDPLAFGNITEGWFGKNVHVWKAFNRMCLKAIPNLRL